MNKMGQIRLIIGDELTEKTWNLRKFVQKYKNANIKTVIISFFSEKSIINQNKPLKSPFVHDGLLFLVDWDYIADADVVGIDDGHNFPDLYDFCMKLVGMKKIVCVTILKTSLFPYANLLLGKADFIEMTDPFPLGLKFPSKGRIHLITGTMFTGKTTDLVSAVEKFHVSKTKKVVIIRREADQWIEDYDQTLPIICCKENSKLCELNSDLISDADVIGIDEAQLYNDSSEFSMKMAKSGKIIFVSALNTTFQMDAWPSVAPLFGIADSVKFHTAICFQCKMDGASFVKRTNPSQELIQLGGKEKYASVCRNCYNNFVLVEKKEELFEADIRAGDEL